MTIHRCKVHQDAHAYVCCPRCECEYCPETFVRCPRTSWHPAHGTTDAEIGERTRALIAARQESARRRGKGRS